MLAAGPQVSTQPDSLLSCQTPRADGQWEGLAWVQGMTCAACAVELQAEASKVQGLSAFELNPASALSRWVADSPEAITELNQRAIKLGYRLDATQLADGELALQQDKQKNRSNFLRFLLALLAMMQIMMYSAPEYLYSPQEIGLTETLLLRWAQWVLCLPVLLYSAMPLFSRAVRSGLQGLWSVDQPIALGLALAFLHSSIQLTDTTGPVWFDCVSMLVTLVLGSRHWVDRQTSSALAHVMALAPDLPRAVDVQTDSGWQNLAVSSLQIGAIVRVMADQVSPLDIRLTELTQAVWVDDSMRSGESAPRALHNGELLETGMRVVKGIAQGVVESVQSRGFLANLGRSMQLALVSKPAIQTQLDRWIPWFSGFTVSVALGTLLAWSWHHSMQQALSAAVAVLLVSCPCALALSWPLVRLFAIRHLASQGLLVRNADALEKAAKIQAVAFDKTGTLTAPLSAHDSGVSWVALNEAKPWTSDLLLGVAQALAQRSAHPLSRRITAYLSALSPPLAHGVDLLSWVDLAGQGVSAQIRLAQDQHFTVRLGSATFCGAAFSPQQGLSAVFLAVVQSAGQALPLARFDLTQTPARLNAKGLQALRAQAQVVLLSGDTAQAVEAWAPQLQFDERKGEQSPQDKADWIAKQQQVGRSVLMCGDGLNDAVAFAQADVSVATHQASQLTAKQADFLMLGAKPQVVGTLIATAQRAHRLGMQNMGWAVAYNLVAVPLAMSGLMTPWMASLGMGVSSAVVFLNASRVLQRQGA